MGGPSSRLTVAIAQRPCRICLLALQRPAEVPDTRGMRITRNPYQRLAAGCALLALIASLTVYPPAAVPLLMVWFALALRTR
jgi:hypothetical protein